jgi:hypothetical protein
MSMNRVSDEAPIGAEIGIPVSSRVMRAGTRVALVWGLLTALGCGGADPKPIAVVTDTAVADEDTGAEADTSVEDVESPEDTASTDEDTGISDEDTASTDATDGDVAVEDTTDDTGGDEDTQSMGCQPGQTVLYDGSCASENEADDCPHALTLGTPNEFPLNFHGMTTGGSDVYAHPSDCATADWTAGAPDSVVLLQGLEGDKRYTVRVKNASFQAGVYVAPYIGVCESPELEGTDDTDGTDEDMGPDVDCYGQSISEVSTGGGAIVSFNPSGDDTAWVVVDGEAGNNGVWHLEVSECDGGCSTHCSAEGTCGLPNSTCGLGQHRRVRGELHHRG